MLASTENALDSAPWQMGVALRAGLMRAPLPLGPAKAGLLRTLHIPNAKYRRKSVRWLAVLIVPRRQGPLAWLAAAWPAAKTPP